MYVGSTNILKDTVNLVVDSAGSWKEIRDNLKRFHNEKEVGKLKSIFVNVVCVLNTFL